MKTVACVLLLLMLGASVAAHAHTASLENFLDFLSVSHMVKKSPSDGSGSKSGSKNSKVVNPIYPANSRYHRKQRDRALPANKHRKRRCSNNKNDYDSYVLAIQWFRGVCADQADKSHCKNQANDFNTWFTLHGLWPGFNGKPVNDQPCKCGYHKAFNYNSLGADLKSKLAIKWPSGIEAKTNSEFLKHEYIKHGTCFNPRLVPSRISPGLQSVLAPIKARLLTKEVFQEAYLKTALELLKRFDALFKQQLADDKIVPSNSDIIDPSKFYASIQKAISAKPRLVRCGSNGDLEEIQICLDLNFAAINCKNIKKPTNCPDDKLVYTKSV